MWHFCRVEKQAFTKMNMELNNSIQLQSGQNEQAKPAMVFSKQEDAVNYILQQSSKGTSVFYICAEEAASGEANPDVYCLGQHDHRMIDFIH